MADETQLGTGLGGLDRVLGGLRAGDNVVWWIGDVEDYAAFVEPFCRHALASGRKLVYFRFASHRPLVERESGAAVCRLDPRAGFEAFISAIHDVIESTGRGACYVFDLLSELASDWYSDQMLGNFFRLTCPHIFQAGSTAYFALLRNYHSFYATTPISETSQLLLDAYRHDGRLHVHPMKVEGRYSPTMNMLHVWQGEEFLPVRHSATIAEISTSVPWVPLRYAGYRLGVWHRTFLQAEQALAEFREGKCEREKIDEFMHTLVHMAVSRDTRVSALIRRYFELQDVLDIAKRLIGTGLIGGKSVGMLLSRAILRSRQPRLAALLEPHDSFFVGSDVYYTFLVRNGIWWLRQEQQRSPHKFSRGEEALRLVTAGTFPEHTREQLERVLDYFGQSPVIVRSSSLLEDNFGNSFAGKYDSVFCADQGPREKRLEEFLAAITTVYASTLSEKAIAYREQKGLLDRDEQMALLIQRVSGTFYDGLFYPQAAGVGLSFNPYAWSKDIDPRAGMLRLVFGLGTRAVERSDDDYTRVVALNAPQRRPEVNFDQVREYSQRRVDVLDLVENRVASSTFPAVARRSKGLPIELFASRADAAAADSESRPAKDAFPWVLTFEKLFSDTDFIADMRLTLQTLQEAYEHPVDVEFTANFFPGGGYKINLVQCRPLPVKDLGAAPSAPVDVRREDMLLLSHGAVIGRSCLGNIDRIIYISPGAYSKLAASDRYSVARLVGRVAHAWPRGSRQVMMLGPGRWGTTMPSLGVPVSFAEINTASALCEIISSRLGLAADVSLGTHFLNELIEMDVLYMALLADKPENLLNEAFLDARPNRLAELVPDEARWADVVRVIDAADLPAGTSIKLHADALAQKVMCYLSREPAKR